MKKLICVLTLLTQISSTLALAAPPSSTPSAEQQLLEAGYALSGSNLSREQMTSQLTQLVTVYNNTAPAENRIDRFQKAMVTMNLYTEKQAQYVADQLRQSALNVDSKNYTDSSAAKDEAVREMGLIFSKAPNGAEYAAGSSCSVFIVVALTFSAILAYSAHNAVEGGPNQEVQPGYAILFSVLALGLFSFAAERTFSCVTGH